MDKETALLWLLARAQLWELLPPAVRDQAPARLAQARAVLQDEAPVWLDWPSKVARVDHWDRLLQPPAVDPVVHERVLTALAAARQLKIDYRSYDPGFRPPPVGWRRLLSRPRFSRHRIHPLGLVRRDRVLYLVARFYDYADIRLLALHRITGALVLEQPAQASEGFQDLEAWLADGHLAFPDGDEPLDLHLRFRESCYQSLWERPLVGENLVLTVPRHGFFEVSGTVADTWALRWWLLGFGDRVEILNPESLRLELQNLRFDQVTGLRVRRVLDDDLKRLIAQARRSHRPLSLLLLDVDDFGRFNKQYGPQAGDRTLRHIADLIQGQVRQMDVVGRYGGEEFAVILPDTPPARARDIAERIRQAIAETPCRIEDDAGRSHEVALSACLGVAEHRPGDDLKSLYERAGAALRRAKAAPDKNRVEMAAR